MSAGLVKKPYLEKFRDNGHYLIDLSYKAVNKEEDDKVKEAILRQNVPRVKKELKDLQPKRILLIKSNVHEILYAELKKEGYNVLNDKLIPFPSHGGQTRFRKAVRKYLGIKCR